jgi:hypothetical protein
VAMLGDGDWSLATRVSRFATTDVIQARFAQQLAAGRGVGAGRRLSGLPALNHPAPDCSPLTRRLFRAARRHLPHVQPAVQRRSAVRHAAAAWRRLHDAAGRARLHLLRHLQARLQLPAAALRHRRQRYRTHVQRPAHRCSTLLHRPS